MSGENGYCPYCGSSDIVPYKVRWWWCNDCNRPFITPVVSLAQKPEEEAKAEEKE